MKKASAGEQLKRWRVGKKLSQTAAAKLVQVEQPTWSRWETGKWRPEPPMRSALRELAGIEEHAWDTSAERALVKRAKVAAGRVNATPA